MSELGVSLPEGLATVTVRNPDHAQSMKGDNTMLPGGIPIELCLSQFGLLNPSLANICRRTFITVYLPVWGNQAVDVWISDNQACRTLCREPREGFLRAINT